MPSWKEQSGMLEKGKDILFSYGDVELNYNRANETEGVVMKFKVVLEKADEGGYNAMIPALEECYSGFFYCIWYRRAP